MNKIKRDTESIDKLRTTFKERVGKNKSIGYLSLSHESGVSYQVIMRFNNGHSISANNAIKIIKALKLKPSEL